VWTPQLPRHGTYRPFTFADESYIDERLFVLVYILPFQVRSTPNHRDALSKRKLVSSRLGNLQFLTITTFPRKRFAPYYITSQEHSVAAQMAYVFKRGEFKVAQCLCRVADVARVFIRWVGFFRNTRQNAFKQILNTDLPFPGAKNASSSTKWVVSRDVNWSRSIIATIHPRSQHGSRNCLMVLIQTMSTP